jgi:hypothetical protein
MKPGASDQLDSTPSGPGGGTTAAEAAQGAQALIDAGKIEQAAAVVARALDSRIALNARFLAWFVRSAASSPSSCRDVLERIATESSDPVVLGRLVDAGLPRPRFSDAPIQITKVAPEHRYSERVDAWFATLRERRRHPCAGRMSNNSTSEVNLFEFQNVIVHHSPFGFMVTDADGRPFQQSSLPLLEKTPCLFSQLQQNQILKRSF